MKSELPNNIFKVSIFNRTQCWLGVLVYKIEILKTTIN